MIDWSSSTSCSNRMQWMKSQKCRYSSISFKLFNFEPPLRCGRDKLSGWSSHACGSARNSRYTPKNLRQIYTLKKLGQNQVWRGCLNCRRKCLLTWTNIHPICIIHGWKEPCGSRPDCDCRSWCDIAPTNVIWKIDMLNKWRSTECYLDGQYRLITRIESISCGNIIEKSLFYFARRRKMIMYIVCLD